ncbi:MAG: hypothetical protein ACXQS8_02130 [Candidatus Helarchaeales archaeon]
MEIEKIIADLAINSVVELQKVESLNVNELDRYMTYKFRSNKGIRYYKDELLHSLEILLDKNPKLENIKEIIEKYCDEMEFSNVLKHIFFTFQLGKYLIGDFNNYFEELEDSLQIFSNHMHLQKEKVHFLLSSIFKENRAEE